MGTFIKSNVEARFSSLIEGTHSTSLFQVRTISGKGIYLQPHQEHVGKTDSDTTIVLTILRGTGEFSLIEQEKKPLHVQIMSGDILVISSTSTFKILNTDKIHLILSELVIH